MGSEETRPRPGWGPGGCAALGQGRGAGGTGTRGSERLILRSLRVCPQLHPSAERFGGAGEVRAPGLRRAELAWNSERLLASMTSLWAKQRGGGREGALHGRRCESAQVRRPAAPAPHLQVARLLWGPRCAQRGWRSDVPAPRHNLLRGENDEERRPYSEFSQIAPRFPWTVFK